MDKNVSKRLIFSNTAIIVVLDLDVLGRSITHIGNMFCYKLPLLGSNIWDITSLHCQHALPSWKDL